MIDQEWTVRVDADLLNIPWGRLQTADGDAAAIPEALTGLAAADADTADRWYWRLDNHVVLQGSLYTAAFEVIPFVIEILRSAATPEARARAYDLLVEIARGEPVPGQHFSDRNPGQSLDEACRNRIGAGWSRYRDDLLGNEPLIRRKALDLVVSLDRETGELKELLESVNTDNDVEFRTAIRDELNDL